MSQDFVHLHVHTYISVQDALPSPTELALSARKKGFPAVAITDHGRMGGVVEFVEACRNPKVESPIIKPIIGQEFYVTENRYFKEMVVDPIDGKKTRPKRYHLTLLAQNEAGYKNLLKSSSIGAIEGYYFEPRIDWEILEQNSEGVICLSGCMAGELARYFLAGLDEKAYQTAAKYKELFGDRYYLELQYHRIPEQQLILLKLMELAKKLDIKCVATNDVHYLEKEDWYYHDVYIQFQNISNKSGSEGHKKNAYGTKEFYLKTLEEMSVPFGQFDSDMLSNTMEINDRVEDFFNTNVNHLLPKSIIIEDDSFKEFWNKNLPYNKENEAYLAYLSIKGLKKLGFGNNPIYKERLKYELKQIWYMGVVDYFLIQREMVNFMKQNEIVYGIRGSGVGSLVNYCLEICPVDPIRWNLMFERFLNPGRGTQYSVNYSCYPVSEWQKETEKQLQDVYVARIQSIIDENKQIDEYKPFVPAMEKELWVLENQGLAQYICDMADKGCVSEHNDSQMWCAYLMGITPEKPEKDLVISKVATLPDVDTDIDDSRRQEVVEWAKNRFGSDHVCLIGSRGTYKARAVVTNTLKVDAAFNREWGENVASKATEISKSIPMRTVPPMTIPEAIAHEKGQEFAGWVKRYPEQIKIAHKLFGRTSHTTVHAAGVLVSSEPIWNSAPIEKSRTELISGFDMHSVEKVGLVKYDYLGLAIYQMMARAIKLIEKRHGEKIDFLKLDFDDKNVFKLYTDGMTSTLFQVAGEGMTGALKSVNVDCLEDLIAVIALFRPGPVAFIPDYITGKTNPESVKYGHPIIQKHLAVTHGIMVYQEQAMFLARDMGGLSWDEVDKLRKAISKKMGKEFDESCALLKKRSLARGIDEAVVDEVLRFMEKFGGYAFNRSHSCSYAVLSYCTAYLRYHYPAEWLACCIHVDKDREDKMAQYTRECYRAGIKIIHPNVNDSGFDTNVVGNTTIALPLTCLKGVGELAKTVVLNQPFDSMTDFVKRARPNRGLVAALAEGRAFDCFSEIKRINSTEEIMELYDALSDEQKKQDKIAAKEAKMKYKSLSPMKNRMNKEVVQEKDKIIIPFKSARLILD